MNESRQPNSSRFNFLAKLLRAETRDELRSYLDGNLDAPLLVEFDPTTVCNYSCPECISADLLNQDRIPSERIRSLIEEFARAGVRGIVLIGGGEPLAHSCMPEPIRQAHSLGLAVGLVTNGSLINRFEDVLAECCSWTRVSMDAGSSATYETFRPNRIRDSFQKVVANMASLAQVKTGALGYSFLVIQRPLDICHSGKAVSENEAGPLELRDAKGRRYITNAHEIYEAARIAKEIGCDYFEYKPMVDPGHYLLPFGQELRDVIAGQAESAMTLVDASFEVIAPFSIEFLHATDEPIQPKTYSTCPAMSLRTLVTPSGIYPCPYHRGREDKMLGTVDDGPFDEFWRSDSRKKAMSLIDPSKDCEFYCIRHQTNVFMNSLSDLHKEGIDILNYLTEIDDIDDPFF